MKFLRNFLKILFFALLGLIMLFLVLFIATSGDQQVAKTVAEDPSIPHITAEGVIFHMELVF